MWRTSDGDGWSCCSDCHWILSLSEFCFLERIKQGDGVSLTEAENQEKEAVRWKQLTKIIHPEKVKRKKLHSLILCNDFLLMFAGFLVFSAPFFFCSLRSKFSSVLDDAPLQWSEKNLRLERQLHDGCSVREEGESEHGKLSQIDEQKTEQITKS